MFENVPERLVRAVKALPASLREPSIRYAAPAGLVIAEYLRLVASSPNADSFFDHNPRPDGSLSYEFIVRTTMIGSTLFLLRSQPAFPEFCRRFQGRDFRSTFFELAAARMFLRGDFQLRAQPETGIKREDFDFSAVGKDDTINVEVTALTAPAFSMRTVRNALGAKRQQLPDNAPAIIFCVHPESWFSIGPDVVSSGLRSAADQFFAGTKRVNAIAFMGEQHWDSTGDGSLGALFLTHLPVVNPSARHPISSLDFFLNVSTDSPRSIVARNSLLDEMTLLQNSEFHQWVDTLFEEPPA
jgi:hypothetical protein